MFMGYRDRRQAHSIDSTGAITALEKDCVMVQGAICDRIEWLADSL
jgi:hypothetical protein